MKQNKLFRKMFLMTLGLGFAILFVQFVFQYFWLDDFYYYSKERQIENELNGIETVLLDPSVDTDTVNNALFESGDRTDSAVAVFDRYGAPIYGLDMGLDSLYLTLLSEEGQAYQVYLDGYNDQEVLLDALTPGKEIRVKGYIDPQYKNEIYPEWLTVDGEDYGLPIDQIDLSVGLFEIKEAIDIDDYDHYEEEQGEDDFYITTTPLTPSEDIYLLDNPQVVMGQITYSNVNKRATSGFAYKENQLFEQQLRLYTDNAEAVKTLNEKGNVTYRIKDSYTGIENLVTIRLVKDMYGEELFIFSVLPLQSMAQTTEIMQSYFYMTVIAAFVLAIVFAYVFSKKITRPLIHLHQVTSRLAKIDFSEQCQVSTNDEIEDLAHNINSMSEQLESTLKQLKQFLADASHELKTPLTVMKGVVEGMMDGVYDINDPAHYQRMLDQINDMSQLVYDLLELSKLESGEVTFKEEVFQLSDLVLKTHNKLSYLVNEKDLHVSLDLDDSFVRGNEQYIETVVRNLYANAVQYTPKQGAIAIGMSLQQGLMRIELKNGPSHIAEEALEKLWQPFFRVEQSRNRALGGTGLGLYMVKEIMDKHQMAYGLTNADGGVVAYFELPIVLED